MDSEAAGHHRTSGMNPWRARCGEIRSAGSEGGPGKRIGRNADTAPRSDPYTYLGCGEGDMFLCAIRDEHSRRALGWAVDDHMRTELVTVAVQRGVFARGGRCAGNAGTTSAPSRCGRVSNRNATTGTPYATKAELIAGVDNWMNFYNNQPRH